MLSAKYPNIAHQVLDANPLNRKQFQSLDMDDGSWLGSVCNGGFSQWKSMAVDISSPQSNYLNQQQLPHDGFMSNNSNMDAVGRNPFSIMGAKTAATELITSPEPISSVTACSEADLFFDGEYWDTVLSLVDQRGILDSNQVAPYECSAKHVMENEKSCYSSAFILEKIPERRFNSISGVALPRHGDIDRLPPNAYMLQQVSGRVRERTSSLSNVAASTVVTSPEGLCQLLPNGNRLDKLSSGKHCGDSSHKNQIHVEKQRETEQQEPCIFQHIEERPIKRGLNAFDTSMVDDSPRPSKQVRIEQMDVVITREDFKKDVIRAEEMSSSEAHTQAKESDKNEQVSGRVCERANSLSNVVASTVVTRPEGPCQLLPNGNWFDKLSSGKHCGDSLHKDQIYAEKQCETEQQEPSMLQHIEERPIKRGLNASGTSMVDDSPRPIKWVKIEHMVHGDSTCDERRDVVITREDLKKDVIRREEMSSSEAHTQAKEKEKIHYPEVPIKAMMTDQFLSPEGTFPVADTTEHIPMSEERVKCDSPYLSEAVDDRTDTAAVLELQNITQGPSDMQLPSKPQEQPNVLSDPQDQHIVLMDMLSEPCQLKSGEIIDSTEARTRKFPVSRIDLFNPDQIKEHISSLRQSLGQPSSSNMMEHPGENCCILCNMDNHYFDPAPLYCARCCNPIKHNSSYYSAKDEMGSRHCFCTKCFKVSRGCNISSLQGHIFIKDQMFKEKNNIKDEEPWVQCDSCGHWLHQICGLYNSKRDQEGNAKYTCPYCRLEEIKLGKHVPSLDSFEARDLPHTKLSDHIEQRLLRKLEREREDRAKFLNKDVNEVPGVGELFVRVVSSVDKIVKVNQDFLNIIPDQDYPTEFPHKLKVILLFQKIEGIDVCLFCMYVQEYGSECDKPNQRSVYISYLDSIKYFRPDIRMVNGEALRTFVYHEILISYLDYCKSCGFAVCYIWACPPFKKEDYIFNCHPETQKVPKPDKLQQWYKSMLKKATDEHIVVNYKTFYDAFIIRNEERSNKITVARLPYFDGDFWSDTAEITMRNLQKENGGESEAKMKTLTKRTMKAMGHEDINVDATNDILVMQKLGQVMLPSKENFLVVYLSDTCKKCQNPILSGDHCPCNQCSDFSFSSRCLEMDPNLVERNMHTSTAGEEHLVSKVAINDILADDKDTSLYNDIFENRHSFLAFCQGHNYQFNTIRRAKYSSMMILYDLSKQMRLIRKTACQTCHKDILIQDQCHSESGPKLRVGGTCCCNVSTPNQFPNYLIASCGVNKYEALPENADEVHFRKALEHASQCSTSQSSHCLQPDCMNMKKLFKHSRKCNTHLAGGCMVCWRIWILISLHSIRCKNSSCKVPRCRDVKEHLKGCSGQCRFCSNWRCYLGRTRCN